MQFRLVDVLAILVIVSAVTALATHACRPMKCGHPSVRCGNNLAQLYRMQANYRASFGHGDFPFESGGDFWLKLTRTEPPLIDRTLREIFHCPQKDHPVPCGRKCDYRGPTSNANTFGDADVVGADLAGNHAAGGNVVRMSGDVMFVTTEDSLWIRAASHTKP